MMSDIQQAAHFYNSLTSMGSYFVEKDSDAEHADADGGEKDAKPQVTSAVKSMSFAEKIQSVKNEL